MYKNVKNIATVLFLFVSVSLCASMYDSHSLYKLKDSNVSLTSYDQFLDGNFDEIIRFDKLSFSDNSLDTSGQDYLQLIIKKIQEYKKQSKEVQISVIGHASLNIQDPDKAQEISKNNALEIQKQLLNNNINKDSIFLEYKGISEPLSLSTATKTKDLSSRVMVTLYVNLPRDLDQDGVDRDYDKCPDTKLGHKVGPDGCKLKTMVVLLAGKNQHSAVSVNTKAGNVVIDKPNQLVSIQAQDSLPSEPVDINKEELDTLLGNTLDETNKKELKYTIYFQKMEVAESSMQKAKSMLEEIAKRKNAHIKIIGHSDTVGTMQRNSEVSSMRTDVISQMIIDAEVSYLKIEKESYSESNLAVMTEDNVFEPRNRRVEVFIN